MIKFISYHNRNPIYLQCGRQLSESLEKSGINEYYVELIENTTWDCYAAWAFKPRFIWKAMQLFSDYDRIVYLDSDAIVMQYPELFERIPESFDIGVHYRNGGELLGGTIYLRNTQKMLKFVEQWANKCQENIKIWDQKVLQAMIDEHEDLNLYCLPPTYCQIFDLMANQGGAPIIKQMQASRLSRGFDLTHNPIVNKAAA